MVAPDDDELLDSIDVGSAFDVRAALVVRQWVSPSADEAAAAA